MRICVVSILPVLLMLRKKIPREKWGRQGFFLYCQMAQQMQELLSESQCLYVMWTNKDSHVQNLSVLLPLTGHLIGCDKKSEIVWYFQGSLCDKLCDFFRANLHCFIRFQTRKNTLMLFNKQFECKGITKHLFQNKVAKFVRLSWPRQEEGHLFNITWRRYTADHTACLWNQNGYPDTAIEGFRCLAGLSLVVNHLK